MSFVHLHVHSEYSLLEASIKVKSLVKKAAHFQMPAVALTDHGNMFGAIEFYFAAKDAGLNPLLGCEVYLAPGSRHQKSQDREGAKFPLRRLVLLAQNENGYRNLCQISTVGYQQGFYYKPRIDYEVLAEYSSDILCLTGGLMGEIPQAFLHESGEVALEKIRKLKEIFSDRLYLETNRTGLREWLQINPFLTEASKITGVPLVAANDVHYLVKEDQMAQEVMVCIGTNRTIQDDTRQRLGSDQFYLKSSEEMRSLYQDQMELCDRTLEIADRCKVSFKLKDAQGKPIYHLPSFPTLGGVSLSEEIRRLSYEGLDLRAKEAEARREPIPEKEIPAYHARLDYELQIIDRMGFNGYFLIVQDFINWAKSQEIPVGPGRGSGAGSLVAFCLRITDLDPLMHKLLFERFLNPERISMPDFDIDFCQDRRGEVIQYVIQKYSFESVSQIITYGKLQARAALRDVGRVLGMTFSEVDVVAKLMPDKLGITLKEALELEPRLREMMEMNPQVATMMDLAQRIEGLARHAGIHAAGVIIADGKLVAHAPLYRGADGENVVQYDMKHAEKIGLIKFDFLGLKTLTHIHNALTMIEQNHGKKIRPQDIPLSDSGIYSIMSKGDTAGIFQFEGEGISDAIRQIRPTSFGDITAINALYRPGPMAMIPEFAKRKNGEAPVEYLFQELREVLEETYGIIVYQEQVMAIASIIAGYSLGEADMLRRAMGKKIKEEMDKQRERFLRGAKDRGHDEKKSDELFDLMYKFADYGFNKSHAAAYCVVAAHTAWLKNYYPAEFFAALLSTEMGDTDKVVKYSKDAQRHGIEVVPPHVNYSNYQFAVHENKIYFGLGAIKGVGQAAVESILETRALKSNRKFETLEDFFESVDLRRINKKVIECLVKAGALDHFGPHRAQLFTQYTKFMEHVERKKRESEFGQLSLFEIMDEEDQDHTVALDPVKPWGRLGRLALEKEVLGFYLSDHPLQGTSSLSSVWKTCDISELLGYWTQRGEKLPPSLQENVRQKDQGKPRVMLVGIISEFRDLITKKGTRMAFGRLEDLTGNVELVIFPDVFSKTEPLFKGERPLLVGGFLEVDHQVPKIIVDTVTTLEEMLVQIRTMILRLKDWSEEDMLHLHKILMENPGSTEVLFQIDLPEMNKTITLNTGDSLKVKLDNEFIEGLRQQFGRTDFIELKGR